MFNFNIEEKKAKIMESGKYECEIKKVCLVAGKAPSKSQGIEIQFELLDGSKQGKSKIWVYNKQGGDIQGNQYRMQMLCNLWDIDPAGLKPELEGTELVFRDFENKRINFEIEAEKKEFNGHEYAELYLRDFKLPVATTEDTHDTPAEEFPF